MKNVPTSVYRFQLSEAFTLKNATALLPYLKDLGVEGVYCSPYMKAHSTHGYDILDPNQLNEKVASPQDYEEFCSALKKLSLFHLADVVPNHMGIRGGNLWWEDVLEKGRGSPYAPFFDIYWEKGKILVPQLGDDEEEIEKEHYKLCHWKTSETEVSYRRFFTINELIGLNIDNPGVFKTHHKKILELLGDGMIQGLRIDHPDGLYDPQKYFDTLREHHKGLIFVEKILGFDEELPPSWPVDGTVGYEFLNRLSGLFVNKNEELTRVYQDFTGETKSFEELLYNNKKSFLRTEMAGDVAHLASLITQMDITEALFELLSTFPVYRSYIRPEGPVPQRDQPYYVEAFKQARKNLGNTPELAHLEKVFSLEFDTAENRDFIMRFQQLSAPAMAKGFEDITLYNYNRHIALNEVGSEPQRHGVTIGEFHAFCQRKQQTYPLGLLTTSTHDTKRSFDTRMRLAPLAEMPLEWEKALQEWQQLNASHKTHGYPEANAEYFLYQTMLGIWESNPSIERLWSVYQKSLREARTRTSWREPNKTYEDACKGFLEALLVPDTPFFTSFNAFHAKIAPRGHLNSLSATALKLAAPGIVDVYEGCEHIRLTLVDPDNRTPVDYTQKPSPKSKLHKKALNFRKEQPNLFLKGSYTPIEVDDHIIAFLRSYKDTHLLACSARLFGTTCDYERLSISLPNDLGRGVELFTDRPIKGAVIPLTDLLRENPYSWVIFKRQ